MCKASCRPAFLMMYSAYKLNKQADNIQPWHTPFPIWNQSVGPCPVLTVASWPAYRFLRRQVRWSGIPILFRFFHSLLWSTQSKALCLSSQSHGFSSSHLCMSELDYKESWVPKNWCFRTVVLEKTLESPLDCKEIQPAHPKGDQSWVFTGRTDVEAETPVLWPPDAKSWLIRKDPDAGKDRRQEEKGTTEDEMARWHRRLRDMGWAVGGGQGGLAYCNSWDCRVRHDWVTELNWICKAEQAS